MDAFKGRCGSCHSRYLIKDFDPAETESQRLERLRKDGTKLQAAELEERKREEREAIRKMMVTTESQPDIKIKQRITIVTAECAYGMNIFKDLFAGVRNVVGGRSKAVENTMRDARETVLHEIKREAQRYGANAVVGVDLDYVELAATGSTMLLLVASGTAVVIEE